MQTGCLEEWEGSIGTGREQGPKKQFLSIYSLFKSIVYQSKDIERFLKQALNLKSLTILKNNNMHMFNPHTQIKQYGREEDLTFIYTILNVIFLMDYIENKHSTIL